MQGSEDSTNGSLLILFESGVKECNTGYDRKTFSPMEGENKADTTEVKVSVSLLFPVGNELRRNF